ncbi:uncharacterized protein LOC108712518 [Xenopus laevis]|uniref:DNA-directed DNA polymerase n=1 Tax=Xenopus laevis TaxID=8355 RepID=A0A8J0UYR2_XENLA|nr:uncharacterized protein LOC108712518 [Xenopus laevis]
MSGSRSGRCGTGDYQQPCMEARRDTIVSRKRKCSPLAEPETTTKTRQPTVPSVLENTPEMSSSSLISPSVVKTGMSAPLLLSILTNTTEMTDTLLGPSELDNPTGINIHPPILESLPKMSDFPHVPSESANPDHRAPPSASSSLEAPMEICAAPHAFSVLESLDHRAASIVSSQLENVQKMSTSPSVPSELENINPFSVLENTPQMTLDTVQENPAGMEVLSVSSVLDDPSKTSLPLPVYTEMSSSHSMTLVLKNGSEMSMKSPEPTVQERKAEISAPLATHSQDVDGIASTSSVDWPPSAHQSTGPENPNIPTQSVEDNVNVDALVHLEQIRRHERERGYFNAVEITECFRFVNLERIESFNAAIGAMHTAVQELLNSILARTGPSDHIQLRLSGEGFRNPIYSKRKSNKEFNARSFLRNVANMLQSNADFLSNDLLELLVIIVKNPKGGSKDRRALTSIPASDLIEKKKRWLIDFNYNEGNLCLAASICALTSEGYITEATLMQKAKEIHDALEIPANRLVSLSDIPAFEKHLQVTIKVLNYKHGKWTFFYTDNPCKEPIIFLLLHKEHYYGIKNITAFCGYSYFCEYCNTQFHGKGRHSCKYFCKACHRRDCPEVSTEEQRCRNCRIICRSIECLELHKALLQSEKNLCKKQRYCVKCRRYTDCEHDVKKCKGSQCRTCFLYVETFDGHRCFMRKSQPETSDKYIVYDCECSQENNSHVPNYIYALKLDSQDYWEFQGPDCLKDFRKTFLRRKFTGFSFIAHNAGRYDAYFVVQELLKENIKLKFLAKGGQLLCVTVADFKIRFIDSFNFLPMKLSKLPKAMGFDDTKGYFPHFFNTAANQAYVGPMPSHENFGQENMMPDEREEFMAWYEENKNSEFNFQAELRKYCQKDVNILKKACVCFRDRVMEMTMEKDPKNPQKTIQVDPFQLTTLASVCMAMFKFKFLTENTIAILPSDNYHKTQKRFSTPSIQWLTYIAHTEHIKIEHALEGGEKQVGDYFLDGFAEIDKTRTAFEFHGCFYHGCPQCYNSTDQNPVTKTTYGQLHLKTQCRKKYLQSRGYQVREIWEHEWKELQVEDHFLHKINFPEPLEPRDALYGGRTNAVKLYHKAAPGEKIFYYDFTSLYPFINKTKAYPVGHPVIYQDKFKDFGTYFGIAKVKVYPPKHLFFPVLPVKMNEKLVFPLCYTCATNGQATECQHCDEERALTGTWCTMEIQLALEKGYTLAETYEVWHFEQQTTKLFEGYINLHLRDKQEASGYPSWCKDEEQRKKYISDYRDKEGVELREEHIAVNPARRQIAKLFLNSLWGKFGQKTNLPNTTVVSDPGEFFRYMFLPEYDVSSFEFMGEETAIVHWKYVDGFPSIGRNSNIFLACFTTAYARLQLYNVLERLQERCLYHDTDSVIFISKGDEWDPPLGDYLGELTSELPDDTHITEFVSAGPKTYGYKLSTGKTCLKVKGITLNASTVQHLHFDSLKDLVLDFPENANRDEQRKITLQQPVITRDRYWQIETRPLRKTLKCVYTKRQLTDDFTTLPFGYRPQPGAEQTQPGL